MVRSLFNALNSSARVLAVSGRTCLTAGIATETWTALVWLTTQQTIQGETPC